MPNGDRDVAVTVGEGETGVAVSTAVAPVRVFADREFRGLTLAQFTSECGDQVAAIAISFLVYGRSNSPFLAAATYAVTYLPWVLGTLLLSPLSDRYPRRTVMLVCDGGRAVLVAILALASSFHAVPIGALIAIVLVSSFFSPPGRGSSASAACSPLARYRSATRFTSRWYPPTALAAARIDSPWSSCSSVKIRRHVRDESFCCFNRFSSARSAADNFNRGGAVLAFTPTLRSRNRSGRKSRRIRTARSEH